MKEFTRDWCNKGHNYDEIAKAFNAETSLKNGSLKLISGEPGSKTAPPIYALGDCGEIRFFIQTKGVDIDRKDLINTLNSLIYDGNICGSSTDRIYAGCISLFFNPAYHKSRDYQIAIERIVETLRKSKLYLEEAPIDEKYDPRNRDFYT